MSDDRLVRDIWKQLPHRAVVGHRLTSRVGGRGWTRPRFAKFARYFERCGLPDPWDPEAKEVEIGLGEVGFGEQKRKVAPHAAPPAEKNTKPALPNVPNAPKAPPPEGAKAAPQIGEQRRDDTAELKRRMAEKEKAKVQAARPPQKYTVDKPLAKLPVRPEVASGEGVPARPRPAASPPRPSVAPPRPAPAGAKGPTRIPFAAAARPRLPDGPEEIEEDEPGNIFGAGRAPVREAPRAEATAVESREVAPPARTASPAPAEAAPPRVEAPPPAPKEPPPAASPAPPRPSVPAAPPPAATAPPPRPPVAAPPKPAAPPSRSPPKPGGGGGGLDDLFGMGSGGGETRIRVKREDAADSKPRRPMVTSAEDLAKAGLDRRPPPPKPPAVVPSSPAPASPEEEPEE